MDSLSSSQPKLNGHRAFWMREDVDRPLVGVYRHRGPHQHRLWRSVKNRQILPGDLPVDDILSHYEQVLDLHGLWAGDLLRFAEPLGAVAWLETIMGCPVYWTGNSMWAKPRLERWERLSDLVAYPESPWLAKLVELTRGQVELSAGRFPVAMPLTRGPLDVAVAVRGLEQFCLDVHDHPDEVRKLLKLCTEAHLHVVGLLADIIPPFHGGHVNYFGLWAPGWPYLHQEDAMASFSPSFYRDMIRQLDVAIMGRFDFTVRKFHSASLHVLDAGLDMTETVAIQVTVDPNGPELDQLCRILSKVQQRKPLLINCASRDNLEFLAKSLSPCGLCLFLHEGSSSTEEEE